MTPAKERNHNTGYFQVSRGVILMPGLVGLGQFSLSLWRRRCAGRNYIFLRFVRAVPHDQLEIPGDRPPHAASGTCQKF